MDTSKFEAVQITPTLVGCTIDGFSFLMEQDPDVPEFTLIYTADSNERSWVTTEAEILAWVEDAKNQPL